MRIVFILLLVAAALAQAVIDWQATIGEGYAYRLTSIGAALEAAAPEGYARSVEAIRGTVPWLWDPVGATLARIPVTLALLAIAGVLWLTRRRQSRLF
jgi:hypothetical protein